MRQPHRLSAREQHWIRRILNAYWAIVLLQALGQVYFLCFSDIISRMDDVVLHLLVPACCISLILGCNEWLHHRGHPYAMYALLISGTCLSSILVLTHAEVRIIPAVFLLSIFVSSVFFRNKLIIYTTLLQILFFLLICWMQKDFFQLQTKYDLLSTLLVLIGGAFITRAVTLRGKEAIGDLEHMLLEKYNLLVQNELIQQRAMMDALTGLPNHMAFQEAFDTAIADCEAKKVNLHLALLDIDDFKSINDTYGHRVGDLVLMRIAALIRDRVRPEDLAARYGGEEFALLLIGLSDQEALLIMEEIRIASAALQLPELSGRSMTVSAGLKRYQPGDTKESFFERTDAWLYQAKRGGKNQIVSPGGHGIAPGTD